MFLKIVLWMVYLVALYFTVFWFLVYFDSNNQKSRKIKKKNIPLVTIVIPAWNEAGRGLSDTIESALALDYPKDKLEIIAIDHGSTDSTFQIMKQYVPRIKAIRIPRDKYDKKGTAMNVGLKKAKGEFFVSFDSDSVIRKDALKKLLPYFSSEEVGVVMPIMKVRSPKTLFQKIQSTEYLINYFYKKLMAKIDCVPVAPGPFSIYRTKMLRELGGYDENNITEDFELTLKIQKEGYKLLQERDSEVYTIAPENIKSFFRQRERWYRGTLFNLKDKRYRGLLFNKKYGDFGIFLLPSIVISGILAVITLFTLSFNNAERIFSNIRNFYFIDFDMIHFFSKLQFNFHILDLNFMMVSVSLMMILVSFFILKKSHEHTQERVANHGMFSLFIFFFFYFLVLGAVWTSSFYQIIFSKRKSEWAK